MSDRISIPCWSCGKQMQNLLLPLSRGDECPNCHADLRCCVGCKNFASHLSDGCSEDRADFVLEKEKANFCDYFKPSPYAFKPRDNSEAELAKLKLAELFGEQTASSEPTGQTEATEEKNQSEAEKALAELNRLFSKD